MCHAYKMARGSALLLARSPPLLRACRQLTTPTHSMANLPQLKHISLGLSLGAIELGTLFSTLYVSPHCALRGE
jgi:hypothetical protein